MRVIRWLVVIVIAVALVVAAAVGYLYTTFDPNDHRDQIVSVVKEKTGRTLRLDAPMSLTFFPWLGVQLEKVTLENPEGFAGDPFASVGQLGVKVQVVPLFNGQLVVSTLVLDGADINLIRKKDGTDNWSDLMKAEEEAEQQTATEPTESWLKGYAVQGIELTNGRVRWKDETSGADYVAEEVNVRTGSIEPGASVPLEASLRVGSADKKMAGRFGATGDIGLSTDFQKVSIPNLQLDLSASGEGLPASGLSVALGGNLVLDNAAGTLKIGDLSLSGPGGLALSGALAGESLKEAPAFNGNFELASVSLRALLDELGGGAPKTTDPTVLDTLQGNLKLTATPDKVVLEPVALKLDDTRIDAAIDVALNETVSLAFTAKVDAIDVDRYLPPPEQGAATAAGGGSSAPAGDPAGGLGALGALNAKGTLSIGTLKVGGLTVTNAKVTLKSGGGEIRLDPISAKLYEGSYTGSIKAKAVGGQRVDWHFVENLKDIQIGPLLKDLTGEEQLEGTGAVQADITGSGLSDAAVRRSAKGKISFDFRDGALKGINLGQVAREVKARLRGQTVQETGPQKTDFSAFNGSLTIGQGKAKNDDLMMKSPFLRISGEGQADLVSEDLDYLLIAKVVETSKGQGGDELSDLAGVPIAVRVGGTFVEPTFSPDFETILKEVAGQRIEEEKAKLKAQAEERLQEEQEKLEQQVEEKAVEELGDALKKLF